MGTASATAAVRRVFTAVPCPECGVPKGKGCITNQGRPRALHTSRVSAAAAAADALKLAEGIRKGAA